MSHGGYLSATKAVLLVAVEQYACHYDWGPATRAELAQLLVGHLCAPSRTADWQQLHAELGRIQVPGGGGGVRTLRAALAARLDEQLQTVDGLHGFFDGLGRLVVNAGARMEPDNEATLLDSESLFGVFVRRCCLAFDQLEFHQVGQFFAECLQAAMALGDGEPQAGGRVPGRSRLELQEHIESLVELLESEADAPVAGELEAHIRQAAGQLPDHSRLHYLAYLSLVRAGESEQSEAALRRFFDSTRDSRATHQYALLYLAAMRAQLGMDAGARQALAEATHIARDCQDHACLLFIVCWEARLQLARLKSAAPDAPRVRAARATISALIDKAASLRCYELQTAGYLQLVELLLAAHGDPRTVFEALLQAQALAIEHNVPPPQYAACHLAAAQAWQQHGSAWLAQLSAQTAGAHTLLAERAQAQALQVLMWCASELCGPQQKKRPPPDGRFAHPATADEVADAAEWLALRDECTAAADAVHCNQPTPQHPAGDVYAAQLRQAQALINDGYVAEAHSTLLAIACPAAGSARPPAQAVDAARIMLVRID
ncbi:hypothetical protein H4R19_002879 [Coemansia spiralis]|nr:hypothetical protein H4R19_002879 [Coemansia spiralis]